MIYAIEAVGTGFIKFGRANSVGRRLAELESGCPHEMTILAAAKWPDRAERAIHQYLASVHERREWFRDSKLARDVISWMLHGEVGYEQFQQERQEASRPTGLTGLIDLRDRSAEHSLAHTRQISRQDLSQLARRTEREQWWADHSRGVAAIEENPIESDSGFCLQLRNQ